MPLARDARIHFVACALMAKRYPHISHEDQVLMARDRRDEAAAALDAADATRDEDRTSVIERRDRTMRRARRKARAMRLLLAKKGKASR